ncbi:uncharacterized protein LOC144577360 isoform X2 [Callithrix jacchus]
MSLKIFGQMSDISYRSQNREISLTQVGGICTISAHYNLHLPGSSNSSVSASQVAEITGTWMNLETIISGKLTQEQKAKHCMFSLLENKHMEGRQHKIVQKGRSLLKKTIICKKLGPHLETAHLPFPDVQHSPFSKLTSRDFFVNFRQNKIPQFLARGSR